MAKQTQKEDTGKKFQIRRRYDGIPFSFGDIKVPGSTYEVFFEYFTGHNMGNFYIRNKSGKPEGNRVVKFPIEKLLKLEEAYKKAIESKSDLEAGVNEKK